MDFMKSFEKRMKQYVSGQINDNNTKIRSVDDINNTTVGGYRGTTGAFQKTKFGSTPLSDDFIVGGSGGNSVAS